MFSSLHSSVIFDRALHFNKLTESFLSQSSKSDFSFQGIIHGFNSGYREMLPYLVFYEQRNGDLKVEGLDWLSI